MLFCSWKSLMNNGNTVIDYDFKPRPNDSNISTQHIPTLLAQHQHRSQGLTSYRPIASGVGKMRDHENEVGPAFASSGQKIATFERNISQHCWAHLVTLLRRVATCCEYKIELVRMPRRNIVARTWPNDQNIMQHPQMLHEKFDHFQIPTCRNMSQHV